MTETSENPAPHSDGGPSGAVDPSKPDPIVVADRIRMLRRLRAIRDFRSDPVPEAAIADILEVARWSGSSTNTQPWRFIVVSDREILRAIGTISSTAGHVGRAPLAIFVVMPGRSQVVEAYDEGRVAERILLAAAAHGLGAAIGWLMPEIRDTVRDLLGIPTGRLVRTVVSIGYPSEAAMAPRAAPGTARLPLDRLIYWERMT